jgi:hypothetical protein
MSRQLSMRHLHLGCGESLSQLLAEPLQRRPLAEARPAKPGRKPVKAATGSSNGGGRR